MKSQDVIFNLEEYAQLFNTFEQLCSALEAVNRLYIWPFLEEYEKNPDGCSKEMVIALLEEIDDFVKASNISYDEFFEILHLGTVSESI